MGEKTFRSHSGDRKSHPLFISLPFLAQASGTAGQKKDRHFPFHNQGAWQVQAQRAYLLLSLPALPFPPWLPHKATIAFTCAPLRRFLALRCSLPVEKTLYFTRGVN